MPAAWGSVLFLSTTCVVRSGICMGSPDSQFMLLTCDVKCDTCFGIRQFMSQKPFMSDCQEEQKARIRDADHCSGSSLALWASSTWSRSTEISMSSTHKKVPYIVPMWCSTTDIVKDMGKCPSTPWKPWWGADVDRNPPLITGPITISSASGFTVERCCLCKY